MTYALTGEYFCHRNIKTAIMNTSVSPEPGAEQSQVSIQPGATGQKEKFFPSGAIAFFIALVILCLVIWFGIYFLMIERI